MQLEMRLWENVKQEDRFYPIEVPQFSYEPLKSLYKIVKTSEAIGEGIISLINLNIDDIAFKWTGYLVFQQSLYTLQYGKGIYVEDIFFSGKLLHDCSPNLKLDVFTLTAYVIKPIRALDRLVIDYEHSEDQLFNSFQCNCGAKNDNGENICKGWISGKIKESN